MSREFVLSTTIRLSDELKARVAAAEKHVGTTSQNSIFQATSEKTAQQELHNDFNVVAEHRYAKIVATGKTIFWHEMRSNLENHLAGKTEPAKFLS